MAAKAASTIRGVRRDPSRILAAGLGLALLTIAAIGAYTYTEIRTLRDEQTAISERNRKGALQLLRIQNDLSSLSSLMRDMADGVEPYPIQGWEPAFARIRTDLAEAIELERALAPADREPAQQERLLRTTAAYWADVDRMFAASRTDEEQARRMIRVSLIPQHRELDGMISQFLIVNNRMQEEAVRANRDIYDRVGREIVMLVAALLAVTGVFGTWIVLANRRAFSEVAAAGEQLRTLSWRMLRMQEDVQRSVSRELHDDFGQLVTAIGTLLGRARRHAAGGGALAAELDEVRAIAQQALDRIRARSQWLHPGVLDDFGLSRALETCAEQFERQTGIETRLHASGPLHTVRDDCAIHVYRIVQEALSNIARHAESRQATIRIDCDGESLDLSVEDHGKGMGAGSASSRGLGLVSMRERAELIGGELSVGPAAGGGVAVRLRVPGCTVRDTVSRPEVA